MIKNPRKYFCWLFGHRYQAIWFKAPREDYPEDQAGIADTEAGCVFCGETSPNTFLMDINEIDWKATTHRTVPPEHRTYDSSQTLIEERR